MLKDDAEKVVEDAAKEKADEAKEAAADESADQKAPDAKDEAASADAEKAAKLQQQFVRLQADFANYKSAQLLKSSRFQKSSRWASSVASCRSSIISNGPCRSRRTRWQMM